jgi:hypothetical protein
VAEGTGGEIMAEFVQTMKDWRRMCKHYTDESMKDGQHSCVDMCPLGNNTACGMIEDALDSDIEVMAKEVAKWAAEHPEPVYQTWGEFLITNGIMKKEPGTRFEEDGRMEYVIMQTIDDPIPAEMAQKLGLEPKEGA